VNLVRGVLVFPVNFIALTEFSLFSFHHWGSLANPGRGAIHFKNNFNINRANYAKKNTIQIPQLSTLSMIFYPHNNKNYVFFISDHTKYKVETF